MLNGTKELAHIVYNDSSVKLLSDTRFTKNNRICFATHWHDRLELISVREGSFKLTLKSEEYIIQKGDLAVIMPREPHSGVPGKDGVLFDVIMFEPSSFFNATNASSKYLEPLDRSTAAFKTVVTDTETVKLADTLISELKKPESPETTLKSIGMVYELLGMLFSRCARPYTPENNIDERFANVLEYVNDHFAENITTAQISAEFGYDEAYFCRRFLKATGLTAMRYIMILRLEAAKELLKDPSRIRTVGEVATACGFSDVSYFTKCFRKHFGITPSEIMHTGKHK